MLGKFFRALFKKSVGVEDLLRYPEGKRIYREFHGLRREQMDPDALKVNYRLNRHGYRSYLVGGCVRDMILKKSPKDFDIATSATPEQVRRVFSNSRSVGRRFKIVHVIFRDGKVIEVSTFRSLPRHRLQKQKRGNYLIRRDNRFGGPQEDATRRDFSINGLYFDTRNESIIDYVGGFDDIQKKCIQAISKPDISFQEDPVRMLRAAKFAALLEFKVASKTASAIRHHRNEIQKANRSRLFDELVKIFRTGKTAQVFNVLHDLGLLKAIFPEVYSSSSDLNLISLKDSLLGKRLQIADQNLAEREDLTITIFMALILANIVSEIFIKPDLVNKANYIRKKLFPVIKRMMLSIRDRDRLFEIFISYPRLLRNPREKNSHPDVFRQKEFFYESFMFFKIYALAENNDENIQKAMFWEIGPRVSPPDPKRAITIAPIRRKRHHSRSSSSEMSFRSRNEKRHSRSPTNTTGSKKRIPLKSSAKEKRE